MPQRIYREAHASVRFFGDDLDPLDVTLALGIPPDHQHRRGEPRLSRARDGTVRRASDYSAGMWSMSSREWVDSPRLEVHLDWLLGQLEPLRAQVETLLAADTKADFFCYSAGKTDQPPSVPTSVRERADSLGIDIKIDHYNIDA